MVSWVFNNTSDLGGVKTPKKTSARSNQTNPSFSLPSTESLGRRGKRESLEQLCIMFGEGQ